MEHNEDGASVEALYQEWCHRYYRNPDELGMRSRFDNAVWLGWIDSTGTDRRPDYV